MRTCTHSFIHNAVEVRFISEFSKIGNNYPLLQFKDAKGQYLYLDVTLGACFNMSEDEWNSYNEDKYEVCTMDSFKEACLDYSFNHEALLEAMKELAL